MLPSQPYERDLGTRVPDGLVAFEMTRIGGRSGLRGGLAVGAFGLLIVALVGFGLVGRQPVADQTQWASRAPGATAAAAGPAATPRDTATPGPSVLVLTSPSHDEAVVVGHLAIVGFVKGEGRDVALAIGDGERVVGMWLLAAAAKAGDPAFDSRAWFETQLALDLLPASRLLWLEVGVELDDGRHDTLRRSFRIGPIMEPDAD